MKGETRRCKLCDTEFTLMHERDRRFCSNKCAVKYLYHFPHEIQKGSNSKCATCGKDFVKAHGHQQFCSNECRPSSIKYFKTRYCKNSACRKILNRHQAVVCSEDCRRVVYPFKPTNIEPWNDVWPIFKLSDEEREAMEEGVCKLCGISAEVANVFIESAYLRGVSKPFDDENESEDYRI